MASTIELDSPRTNGLKRALLYCDDEPNPRWGWWCPSCTDATNGRFTIGNENFISRDKARRAAHLHEERRGH